MGTLGAANRMTGSIADPDDIICSLTKKQREALVLIADARTGKEIAAELGISESAAVQRIETLRAKFGGVPRSELGRIYRDSPSATSETCNEFTGNIFHLSDDNPDAASGPRNKVASQLHFHDSISFRGRDHWVAELDESLVPEVLNGRNAVAFRWMAVICISLGMLITTLTLLAVAQAMGEMF